MNGSTVGPARRIVLSPHCADAVLGCGGWMARPWRSEAVSVINLFAGRPGYDRLGRTPILEQLAAATGDLADPIGERRAEDAEALALFGVEAEYWNHLEAVHRMHGGRHLYPTWQAITGTFARADRGLVVAVRDGVIRMFPEPSRVTLFAPLALGDHVDHRIARDAARLLATSGYEVWFYEDLPYARTSQVPHAIAESPAWTARLEPLDEGALAAKVRGICAYRTQLAILTSALTGRPVARSDPEIESVVLAAITRHAERVGGSAGPAERLWHWSSVNG
jgi:LmbE family N-acetylglucosaminyl deacetylase